MNSREQENPIRVAVLSFLFNWPSTGGGIVHTVELADFLGRAGYAVRHIYARFPEWGIGRITRPVPFDSRPLDFDAATFCPKVIEARFREAVCAFDPDYVIITDSWNSKPFLAEAVRGFPYLLRLQASEWKNDVNMRVFEALASGSFLLTNDLAENGQADLFRDGLHLATYRDAHELLDKLRFYLRRDDARERIAAAGRAEALAKHTYRHRMHQLLAIALATDIGDRAYSSPHAPREVNRASQPSPPHHHLATTPRTQSKIQNRKSKIPPALLPTSTSRAPSC